MAKNNEVGNPAKIKDLNDAIVLLNSSVMHPKKRLKQTPAPKSKRSESTSATNHRGMRVWHRGARDYYSDER